MTGMTLTEKIIARTANIEKVVPGEEIWVSPDRMSMNDTTGPRRIAGLIEELGGLKDKNKVILASDHFFPPANIRHAEILKQTREWAQKQEIQNFYEYKGVLHNLLLQEGHILPGMLLVGADSHTVTAGAVGALAVAVGSTELATVLATGKMWMRVPKTIRIELTGKLAPFVDIRDITMHILKDLGSDHALYSAIEYDGDFIENLNIEERLVLSNQGIEMGAKNAVVSPTQKLLAEIETQGKNNDEFQPVYSDSDANFHSEHHYKINTLDPLIAFPHTVDNVQSVSAAPKTKMNYAWIGSCVGGRFADLQSAAEVVEGKKVKIPLFINPATSEISNKALDKGIIKILVDAGAIIQPAGCGACAGLHSGVAATGENIIATATRNFKGRMGSRESSVYLASPFTVAASALAGRIADPREIALERQAA